MLSEHLGIYMGLLKKMVSLFINKLGINRNHMVCGQKFLCPRIHKCNKAAMFLPKQKRFQSIFQSRSICFRFDPQHFMPNFGRSNPTHLDEKNQGTDTSQVLTRLPEMGISTITSGFVSKYGTSESRCEPH